MGTKAAMGGSPPTKGIQGSIAEEEAIQDTRTEFFQCVLHIHKVGKVGNKYYSACRLNQITQDP